MKKYIIQASEVIYYEIEVEASNQAEAIRLITEGEVSLPDPVDSSDFNIGFIDVEEIDHV